MKKKGVRIAIALILALGLILSMATMDYAKGPPTPKPQTFEITNLHVDGTSLNFQLHIVNYSAIYYKCNITNPGSSSSLSDTDLIKLPRITKEYTPEISRDISSMGKPLSGTYTLSVTIYDRKGVSLDGTATATCSGYNVIFNETNNLSGVTVDLYSKSGSNYNLVNSISTVSGKAITNLWNGTYYYAAHKSSYGTIGGQLNVIDGIVYIGDSTVASIDFTMAAGYTVTFNVTNDVDNVKIDIRNYGTSAYLGTLDTGTTGSATVELSNGHYSFAVQMSGFKYYFGDFTVPDDSSISFTLVPVYTVTFDGGPASSGDSIYIYNGLNSDPNYADYYGTMFTDELGKATDAFTDGDYHYQIIKFGYDDVTGSFTVNGGDLETISFTMTSTANILFSTDFTDATVDELPAGWGTYYTNDPDIKEYVYVSNTNQADAVAPELELTCNNFAVDDYGVYTPEIPVAGATNLNLRFVQYVEVANLAPDELKLSIEVSEDGGLWNTVYEFTPVFSDYPGGEIGSYSMSIPFSLSGPTVDSIRIRWHVSGYVYNLYCWEIDNIVVTENTGNTVAFNETNTDKVPASIQVFTDSGDPVDTLITDAEGTASFELQNGSYSYLITASGYGNVGGQFAVPDSGDTIDFELLTGYTVNFNESQGLSGVEIKVFNHDPFAYLGTIYTDSDSGSATIELSNGSYYFYANAEGYAEFGDDILVNGTYPDPINFTMIPTNVTFAATPAYPDIAIEVYQDGNRVASTATDEAGKASIALPEGDYHFNAIVGSYAYFGNFAVSSDPLNVNFEMAPTYAVTLQALNNVTGFNFSLYSSPDHKDIIKETTDGWPGAGRVSFALPTGTYYYGASGPEYAYISGTFTVTDPDQTFYFTLNHLWKVSFSCNVEDAYIEVFADADFTEMIDDYWQGNSPLNLIDGTYYYRATNFFYDVYEDQFTVAGAAVNEVFTMIAKSTNLYTVTFNEGNGVSNVYVDIYSGYGIEPDRSNWVDDLYTPATINLPDGDYYFDATREGYANYSGIFEVYGGNLTVGFTLSIFTEDFNGVTDLLALPTGWTTSNLNSGHVVYQNLAGGSLRELVISADENFENDNHRVSTPSIDTAAATKSLNLSFRQYFQYSGLSPSGYTVRVEVSDDGGTTWTPTSVTYTDPTTDIGPETANVDLSDYIGQTIMISWHVYGNTFSMNFWCIDDVVLNGN